MPPDPISFQTQFRILIDMLRDPQGKPYSIATLAQAANVSDQSLLYLLDGRTQHPRLETVRALCRFYHISLDYFDCETEAACRVYLLEQISASSNLLHTIAVEATRLTPKGQRSVLAVLEWLRRSRKVVGQK
jgi:transcriptional regulator with XRE-family HTH domain